MLIKFSLPHRVIALAAPQCSTCSLVSLCLSLLSLSLSLTLFCFFLAFSRGFFLCFFRLTLGSLSENSRRASAVGWSRLGMAKRVHLRIRILPAACFDIVLSLVYGLLGAAVWKTLLDLACIASFSVFRFSEITT